jgi:phenylpropionate dioxygenase-like ring-hydroxylating dioxygenase large terminal subunit
MDMPETALHLLQSRQKYFSLPQPFYNSTKIFKLDLAGIFYTRWLFAGMSSEIATPGSYLTFNIGRTSIVVLRDHDGDIRAFFNTCRHRGSKICFEEHGHLRKHLVCPYHQWTYDLSGKLFRASRMHADFDASPERNALKRVHARDVGGLIYVCLAEPPTESEFARTIGPYLSPHDFANAKVAHRQHITIRANWKLFMENSRECYHCPATHPELLKSFVMVKDELNPGNTEAVSQFWKRCHSAGLPYEQKEGDDFVLGRMPLREGYSSMTLEPGLAVSRPISQATQGMGAMRWVHYPSMTNNHVMEDYGVIHRVLPIDAESTLLTCYWITHRDAVEGEDYNLTDLTKVWLQTNAQDHSLTEHNQEGVNSSGYQPGPYSREIESGVIKFVEWYCSTMGPFLKRSRDATELAA